MRDENRHLTPIDQDVLRLGGLPDTENGVLRRHLSQCAICREESAARAERAERYRREGLPAALERLRKATGESRGVFRRRLLFGALPAVAVLALYLAWPSRRPPDGLGGADLATKGAPAMRVVVRRGDHVFAAPEGSWLSPGDALRFVVGPTGYPYLLIVSVDGAGKANVYHPFRGGGSAPVDPARSLELPSGSVVLDDAPGPERIFAVFSREPLQSEAVLARLQEIGSRGVDAIRNETALNVPGTVETSVLLEKLTERGQRE